MEATVKILGVRASIKNWKWTCSEKLLEDDLNSMLDHDGPSGADPAPNYHAAFEAAEMFGGAVIDYKLPEYVSGRVY